VWRLGDENGLTPDEIEAAIADIDAPLARPSQGLPPSVGYYEHTDNINATLEIPLWTHDYETDVWAIVKLHRVEGRWASAYRN
jgi:hypothetical protein